MAEVRTNLRMPEGLYEQVKLLAEEDFRSINAEIIVLVMEAVATRIKLRKEQDSVSEAKDKSTD